MVDVLLERRERKVVWLGYDADYRMPMHTLCEYIVVTSNRSQVYHGASEHFEVHATLHRVHICALLVEFGPFLVS